MSKAESSNTFTSKPPEAASPPSTENPDIAKLPDMSEALNEKPSVPILEKSIPGAPIAALRMLADPP